MNPNAAQEAEQFWNERFDVDEFIFGKDPNLFLVESTKKYATGGSRVLCVADGEGRNSVWLAQQGMQVDAFDVSAVAIKKAKKFASDNQVDIVFHHSDCDSYPWQLNQYDAIAAIFIQFADPELRARLSVRQHGQWSKTRWTTYRSRVHSQATRIQNRRPRTALSSVHRIFNERAFGRARNTRDALL